MFLSNITQSTTIRNRNLWFGSENKNSLEITLLYGITLIGILFNVLTMIFLLIIPAYRIKSSCFLFHHCLICLTLSLLCFPYSLSFSNHPIRCDYLGNIQVTCVTAQLLNMAAMVASEAYRFEDLTHQETLNSNQHVSLNSSNDIQTKFSIDTNRNSLKTSNSSHHYFEYQLKQSNQSTISCGCLSFGILIIWFSSIILHLGITMIGTESKSYYHESGKYCNFIITDIRGYVLTLMWIIITIFSLLITVRYIHKILKEVSSKRRHHQPLLSLAIFGQNHGQSIATRDILMQQIEQRIQLNILLIILFILFWFPLFIVTLFYIKFKIPENVLRYLLLLAWSNSSLSPLGYCILLPKCSSICSFCCRKDRSTTYDSLTSYYNRIGDRFHDIGKWDQYQTRDEQENNHSQKHLNQSNSHSNIEFDQTNPFQSSISQKNIEHFQLNHKNNVKTKKENSLFSHSNSSIDHEKSLINSNLKSKCKSQSKEKQTNIEFHSNSLIVKEIQPINDQATTNLSSSSSSSSSLSSKSSSSSIRFSSHHRSSSLANGLLVTSIK